MTPSSSGDAPTESERLLLRRLQLEQQRLRARGGHLLKTYREHLKNLPTSRRRRPEEV